MIDQRDSLAREVDEELRREQLLRLWEKYGTYLVAAVALIVIGVGGVKYYQYRTTVASEAAGSRLAEATRRPVQESAEAQKILQEIGSSGPAGYATLAKLRLAAAEREAGRLNEAIAAYEAIAKQGGDRLLADYARLQAASLKVDSAGWTDMQNRLNDLAADGNPWRASARELLGLAAMKAGKIEEAREQFQRLLSDRDTPPSISERARIMMAMLTEKELSTPPAAAPSESTKTK